MLCLVAIYFNIILDYPEYIAAFCINQLIYFLLYCKRVFWITQLICIYLVFMTLLAFEYMLA